MQSFFNQISAIRDQISVIQTNITTIATLHQKAMNTISEEESHRTQQEIEGVMDKTNKLTQDIRTKIKKLDEENKSMVKKPDAQSQSDARIRISQHSSLLKKFLDTVQQYKDTQQKFQDKYKQRLQRQFLIVKPNATEEEIEKVMDGKQGPIFAQEIKMTGQRREAQRALDDIQERHRDILRIEQSIIELQQLFMDMAVLVSAQGDMLNQIDIHVSNAVDYTEAGTQELTKAVKLQKKARK
ncbi:t-SNARE, partial [Gaertneriomyces semiglobifer]